MMTIQGMLYTFTGPCVRPDHHGRLRSRALRYPGPGAKRNAHPTTDAMAGTTIGSTGSRLRNRRRRGNRLEAHARSVPRTMAMTREPSASMIVYLIVRATSGWVKASRYPSPLVNALV